MTFWTLDKVEKLKALYQTNTPWSDMKALLGAGKNKIIGKANRMGLRRPPMVKKPARSYYVPRAQRTPAPDAPPPPPILEPVIKSLKLIDLGYNQCRYPTSPDDAQEHLFCGEETANGISYCPYHMRQSYSAHKYTPALSRGQR